MRKSSKVSISEKFISVFSEGLRTLVISQKLLENDQFERWQKKYKDAKADLNNREELMQNCIEELE